jgi:ATP-dependent DNA helicase DinG
MDEAHEAPEIAMDFYGWQMTERSITQLARSATDVGAGSLRQTILEAARALFGELENRVRRSTILQNRVKGLEDMVEAFGELGNAYRAHADNLREDSDLAFNSGESERALELSEEQSRFSRLAASCFTYKKQLLEISSEFPGARRVYNMERRDWSEEDSPLQLQCRVVETGPFFKQQVFDGHTVIATSATLTAGRSFGFIARRFGLDPDHYNSIIAPTPFDPGNVMVYVPGGKFPEPSHGNEHAEAVADEIYDIAKGISGRTMALFTSYRNLNTSTKILRKHLHNTDFQIFVQGELPQMRLIAKFMEAEKAIILATASFWKGVDIPGRDLSCVIIDKIPFARPDNPVLFYLEHYQEESAFHTYSIPQAVITLKQGMGRLIRRESDYGAICIMDPRINIKGYGKRIKSAFPDDCWLTDDWQDVVEFIQDMDEKSRTE